IAAAELRVSAAREALKGVKIETEVGERAFFEILDAQREYVNAEVELERAKRDMVVSSYTLIATVGRLRAHLLGLVPQSEIATDHQAAIQAKPVALRTIPAGPVASPAFPPLRRSLHD
ncbi:MAG: TolC family protein, partial [Pseudomonadota bacterium]|nr:TolC family protein [Pseudomonadota bacterium]